MKATAKNVIKAKNAALVAAQEVLASDSKVSKKFRKEIAEKIVIPARKLKVEKPKRKRVKIDFLKVDAFLRKDLDEECSKYTKVTPVKNSVVIEKTTKGNKVGRDRAPGAPTIKDYRKALDSAKYLLDLIVDAMERKRKHSHRQLTKNDWLRKDGEFVDDYWCLPLCKPGVGEKFEMHLASCAGVSPAIDEARALVNFILDAVEEGK